MKKTVLSVAAFAAVVFGAAAIVRSIRRSSSTSTFTGTDTPITQPEPQTPASTSHAPSDDQDEHRVIGKIDLTQFSPDRAHRRVRIGSRSILAA